MPDKVFRLFIEVDSTKAKRGAKETTTALGRVQSKVAQMAPAIAMIGVGMAAMFLRSSIKNAIEQEQALAGVESQLRATGHAAGLSSKEIAGFADEMQRLTGIDNEAVLRTSAVLLSFKQLTGEVFRDTLIVAQDLATVMQGDLTASAMLLAKALADPVARLGELSRSGIIFTDSQKELIKSLVESGKLFEAQTFILEELKTQYGGAAVAARETLGGAFRALGAEWADLQKNLILGTGANNPIRVFVEGGVKALQYLNVRFQYLNIGWATILSEMEYRLAVFDRAVMNVLASIMHGISQFALAIAGALAAIIDSPVANIVLSQWLGGMGKALENLSNAIRTHLVGLLNKADKRMLDALNAWADAAKDVVVPLSEMPPLVDDTADALERLRKPWAEIFAPPDKIGAVWFPHGTAEKIAAEALKAHEAALRKVELFMQPEKIGAIWFPPGTVAAIQRELDKVGDGAELDGFADKFGDRMGQALANAFASGDVKNAMEGLTNALAAGVASAVSDGISSQNEGAGGAIAGGVVGGVMGGVISMIGAEIMEMATASERAAEKAIQAWYALEDAIQASLDGARAAVAQAWDDIAAILQALHDAGQGEAQAFEAIGRELNGIVEAITGIAALDFGSRLTAAAELVEIIGNYSDRVQAMFDGIDLSALADQLTQEFLGVTAAIDLASIRASANELEAAIIALGLSSSETAKLIQQVQMAERHLINERMSSALGNMASLMEQAGINSAQAANIRAKAEQLIFQVAVKRLKVELIALDMWTRANRKIIRELMNFANELGNFVVRISGEIKAIKMPSFSSPNITEDKPIKGTNPAIAERRSFMDELNRMINETSGPQTFADRMRDLSKWFEDATKKAERLHIPLKKVTAAYEAQLQALRDQALAPLIAFRDSMSASGSSPTLEGQFFTARSKFFDLARLAQTGDLDAISQLGGAGQSFLDLAKQMFGSTSRFDALFDEVFNIVNSIIDGNALTEDAAEVQHNEVLDALSVGRGLEIDLHNSAQNERRQANNWLRGTVVKLTDIASSLERMEAA